MPDRNLFYTSSHGADPAARKRAMGKLLELAQRQEPREAFLALPYKANLENYQGEGLLPDAALNALAKIGSATVQGVTIRLHVERGGRRLPARGPVLALDSNPSLLESVLNDDRATAVIFVPWTESELAAFRSANPAAEELT